LSYLKKFTQNPWAFGLILAALVPLASWAQVDTTAEQKPDADQSATGNPQQDQTPPAPAFGSGAPIPSATENPPISGLDRPSLEPGAVSRSFLAPGAILSESADSNVDGTPGGSNNSTVGGVARVMGSLTLQKIFSRYETDLQYIGGGIFYEGVQHDTNQIHEAELAQRIVWRTGQLALRDGVSYLPEGSFGAGSYGGSGALQAGLAGLGTQFGGLSSGIGSALGGTLGAGQFGSVGQTPRLTNSVTADLVEAVTPRSSVTLAGSYGFVHFTNNPLSLVDSDQESAQFGYDRQINRTDQVALSYGFQKINFPQISGSSVTTNTVHFIYGHRLTGRMDFVAGAGPQFTHIQGDLIGSTNRISASGNLRLRYRFPRTSVQLEYRHYNTNGSGSFLGAKTDVGSISVLRPLGRVWEAHTDIGIANNEHLVPASVAVPATSDRYVFAGATLHRHIGRRYRMFLSYQYNRFSLNSSTCSAAVDCGISNRHTGVVGMEWYPRPIRLD
jgi:hypothetical protein